MNFQSIRIEGGILSPDILDRIEDVDGQKPAHFELDSSSKVKNEVLRVWADAQHYWNAFQHKIESLKADSPATTETRNLWIVPLLTLLGYQLEYQARGTEVNGKNYPISHRVTNRKQTPLHIIGYREPSGLDRKPERMALRMSAHAMVQEHLNLCDQLYGIVTNGRLLRVLRDSSRLVKLSYLEFDLDRIFTDGLFADFAVLFRLLHATRLPKNEETTASCWLERYHQKSIDEGTRIRNGLRDAVTEALEVLGTGFLSHSDNTTLRQQVSSKELRPETYFSHLLRLVYRLLFLMVVEERGLVFPWGVLPKNVALYFQHYSVQRLRKLAVTRGLKIERFHDIWLLLLSTFQLFENPTQAAKLGTTVFGGQLFDANSLGPLTKCRLSNAALFTALERLCYFNHPETKQRISVNFGALATEEFGSVYESLLELHAVVETGPTPHFGFRQIAGNERKTTGSYYTPTSLVTCLLDSALEPILDERIQNFKSLGFKSVDEAVLALNVCDPACGSGHFLIAAAQRIARRLAILRAGDEEPSPELLRHTLREVIGNCIHGVDVNPMSVELCKVALWLEAVEPGKPLNFLDHHIKCGNSLLGATPNVIKKGIPDAAYEPITGDNKEAVKWMRQLNKAAREGQGHFDFAKAPPWERQGNLPAAMAELETLDDETPEALLAKENLYRQIVEGSGYESGRLLHDTWCAGFVWLKGSREYGTELTTEHLREIERNPHSVSLSLKDRIRDLARKYRFFHWHLEFPAVFGADANGGFDVILGNPPWERTKLQEKEWFADRSPEIAKAPNAAARKRLIARLAADNPNLMAEFESAQRHAEGASHFMRNSALYPLCGRGDVNLYAIFAELGRQRLTPAGCIGLVVPSGIATDDTTKFYFQDVIDTRSLVSLFDFENRLGLFPTVDSRMKFCLFTAGSGRAALARAKNNVAAEFIFFAHSVEDLQDPNKRFTLSAEDIALLNPDTHTCPIFRSRRDAELNKEIYGRTPTLCSAAGNLAWGGYYMRLIDMDDHSEEIRFPWQNKGEGWSTPLYEAKLIHLFDHRFTTFAGVDQQQCIDGQPRSTLVDEKRDPNFVVQPRYFVRDKLAEKLFGKYPGHIQDWLIVWRDVARATDERTSIVAVIPKLPATRTNPSIGFSSRLIGFLLQAILSSFAFDYIARQKVGGIHFNWQVLAQLPVLTSGSITERLLNYIKVRVLELTFTAWDLKSFAQDCGFDGPPFRWNEERRFQLRCELDAAFFHLYLGPDDEWLRGPESLTKYFPTPRDAVAYIMDTFPIVQRKDEEKFGTYRTKDTILNIYDALAESQRTGRPFVSPLSPPPADPQCCHPKKKIGILAFGSLIHDPGEEIERKIVMRIRTITPFPVEFGRYSGKTRGGAPTLVRHEAGEPVSAEIFVLDDSISIDEARDMLWRRERRKIGSAEKYVEGTPKNSVLVREFTECPSVASVLYTDFPADGKIGRPTGAELAAHAIESVKSAEPGMDGITYLMKAIAAGIKTPLTEAYAGEILRQSKTNALQQALENSKPK